MTLPPAFARGARRADAPQRAHYGRIFDVACCPWDDSLFATAGEDETARVWRDDSRSSGGSGIASHGVCRGHKDEVVRVAWHPTMRILASGSADGAVAVWKVAPSGAERAASAHDPDEAAVARVDVLGPHPGEVYGCSFVGDGEGGGPMLATAAGTDLRLWDLEAAVEVARVPPLRAAKEPDGSPDETVSGPASKKKPDRWEPGFLFSLSGDGGARGLLASACSDGTVKLWGLDGNARSATAVASVASHPNALATATAFLPCGNLLASAGSDGRVVVCDVRRSCRAVRRITPPCVATGLCAVQAPRTSSFRERDSESEACDAESDAAATEKATPGGYLLMSGRDGVVRAVRGEGAGPSAALSPSETNVTPLLCVASDRDGARVFAAGNTRERGNEVPESVKTSGPASGSGPFGVSPGPFGFVRRNGNLGALGAAGGAKPRAEPAEIFVWDALLSAGEEDEDT
jgi:WD40 repeat protein